MATYIHLTNGDWPINDVFGYEIVMKCVRDYQVVLNLRGEGETTRVLKGLNPDATKIEPLIDELANECETLIQAPDSTLKWSILWNSLKKHQRNTSCPIGDVRTTYIQNPLLTGVRCDIGDWSMRDDGIYYMKDEGFHIPKGWLIVFSYDYLEEKMRVEMSPAAAEESPNAMTLLSMLRDELLYLNSRNSKDRSPEIERKINNLSKVARVLMEESEDDE